MRQLILKYITNPLKGKVIFDGAVACYFDKNENVFNYWPRIRLMSYTKGMYIRWFGRVMFILIKK